MAQNITTNATVNLNVNDQNAAQTLDALRKRLETVKDEMRQLASAGVRSNDPRMRALRSEYQMLSREIRTCQSELSQVDSVLRRLDTATTEELNRAMRTLRNELRSIERGSDAWRSHVEQIRRLQGALNDVNAELRTQESRWSRMNRWLNDTQTAIMGAAAALSGLVMAVRSAVQEFLEMDQEMANVRKFTGMTADQVTSLNEKFKGIDTRSGRDELNKLAQEAGRLGKQSEEDVLGFVRAADKINVALDDLGDGATLKLSKLTGIFGDEKILGTEKALLSVGSVINELSQNCSASAPYLAQFASRMGGVAAQAGMTIQQVMALGAVLDTTNQGVEAASTAVSQVITRLYQDTAKYAKVAGLDVKEFTDLLKKDANAAFIQFLETLNKAGGMDVLSPMFADMGETGARAIAALSSLATHIDEVKAQQEEANKAYREAISIDKEFEVQNTTLLAQQEKAKKQFVELAIEVGQKIQPMMKYVYSSSSIMMRVLNMLIDFISSNIGTIVTLATAIGTYSVAVNLATIRTKAFTAAQAAGMAISKKWPSVLLLWDAAVATLHGDLKLANRALLQFFRTATLHPLGMLIAAVGAATMAITKFRKELDVDYRKAMDKATQSASAFAQETRKEQKEIDRLFGALDGATKGTKAYDKAKNEIISRYGVYLQGIINEAGEITNLALAYDRLTFAAKKSAKARAMEKAKGAVEEQYYSQLDTSTEQLRGALEKMGMPERDTSRLVSAVTQAIYSGGGIPDDVFREISRFSEQNMGIVQNLFGESPVDIMLKLRSRQQDYKKRTDKFELTDERYFRNVPQKNLDSDIEELSKKLTELPDAEIEINFSVANSGISQRLKDLLLQDGKRPEMAISNVLTPTGLASATTKLSRTQAETLLREMLFEKSLRPTEVMRTPDSEGLKGTGYVSSKAADKEAKKAAAEARAEKLKAQREFREGLAAIKAETERNEAAIVLEYSKGEINYMQYLKRKQENEEGYYDKSMAYYKEHFSKIKDYELDKDNDYAKLLSDKADVTAKYVRKITSYNEEGIKRVSEFEIRQAQLEGKFVENKTIEDEEALAQKILDIRVKALRDRMALHKEGSEEWERLDRELSETVEKDRLERQLKFEERIREAKKQYAQKSVTERYNIEKRALESLYALRMQKLMLLEKAGKITSDQLEREVKAANEELEKLLAKLKRKTKDELPGKDYQKRPDEIRKKKQEDISNEWSEIEKAKNAGIITEQEAKRSKYQVAKEHTDDIFDELKNNKVEMVGEVAEMATAWVDLWAAIDAGGSVFENLSKAAEATFAVVTAGIQMASQFAQANAKIEIAAIEKRYDREAELAQGNTYLTKKLEKEKQEKVAEIKNKAAKAEFKMALIQATGTMIMGAMNAYTSTLKIPIVGPALAPAAAAVALAAGAANIALLTKQQEASEAQGYSEGGYTRKGRKNDVAGVVHAGEWVASQRLLEDPVAAAVVGRLERAQRTPGRVRVSAEEIVTDIDAISGNRSGDGDYLYGSGDGGRVSAMEVMMGNVEKRNVVPALTVEAASRLVGAGEASYAARSVAESASGMREAVRRAGEGFSYRKTGSVGGAASGGGYAADGELRDALVKLVQRLDEPFVTVNHVAGEHGIQAKLDEYDRMMRNKTTRRRKRWS